MTISVQIDSNAWNFLFKHAIDINLALPLQEFKLFITREVEIEILAIPDDGKDGGDKRPLKQYIKNSIARNNVRTTMLFGFAEANPVDGPAIYGGFDQGTFQSEQDRVWRNQEKIQGYILGKSKKGSGLTGNQADTAVAAASFHSVVLTCDNKAGPIPEAIKQGGNVIFLTDALLEANSLSEIVRFTQN
jgi:hypothetical protein